MGCLMSSTEKFENVTVVSKANIYFEGKVVSHTIILNDAQRKTLGIIYPGNFTFNTGAPEKMEIIAGVCKARLKDQGDWKTYCAGQFFKVPGNSSFDISVESGIAEYICSFE